MAPELSIIAPCLNEQDNVKELYLRVCKSMVEAKISFELILVDDGSADSTWLRMNELLLSDPLQVRLVQHLSNRGIAASWKSGLEAATGRFVCLIDSDLQNPPELIPSMFRILESSGCDLVRGARVPIGRQPLNRKIMSRFLNFVLNVFFRMRSIDNKSGFIISSSENLSIVVENAERYAKFQTFLGVATHHLGLRVTEVLTPFEPRKAGVSFLDGRSIKTVKEVVKDFRIALKDYRL